MNETFVILSILGCLTTIVGGVFIIYINKIPKNNKTKKLFVFSVNIK